MLWQRVQRRGRGRVGFRVVKGKECDGSTKGRGAECRFETRKGLKRWRERRNALEEVGRKGVGWRDEKKMEDLG